MDKDQREQVREMLHDVLSGYHAKVDAQNTITNDALIRIDKKFEKLNGSVAEHGKIISDNLPHNVALCPQAKTIESLKENMISSRAIKTTIITSIGITGTLVTIIFLLFKLFTNTP